MWEVEENVSEWGGTSWKIVRAPFRLGRPRGTHALIGIDCRTDSLVGVASIV
jgi:hypothetical protein